MGEYFFFFLFTLLVVAIILGEDYVFTLLYLFFGAFIFGRWWGQRTLSALQVRRSFTNRAFLGEKIRVSLQVSNRGWLPVPWLHLRESLPHEVYPLGHYQRVTSLGPKGSLSVEYEVDCRKRGYYPIGPLEMFSGDVLGVVSTQARAEKPQHLTVYPRIIPLSGINLPSFAPLGTLRHRQPIFEDPSRVRGKRDYVSGDSLRRVDWKASAITGRLQVKLFEPSIALETAIFLNLNTAEFDLRSRFDAAELAIIVAASLANWIVSVRQAVGLATNGHDPQADCQTPPAVPPRRGRGHLLRILDVLARIQAAESEPLVALLQREMHNLTWGTTLIVITNRIDTALFDGLFQARRRGLNAFLLQVGPTSGYNEIRRKAEYFGFPIHQVLNEKDLDVWRRN
ncbi:MAG: DUF58 domain-containing protein [Anaerolineales bacterium]|nr:DUF58 domain-containing protein [Anaerolineales bacterium]